MSKIFMALSKSELKHLNDTVIKQDSRLEQFPSVFSILLANDKHFFKIIPDIFTQIGMKDIVIQREIMHSNLRFDHLVYQLISFTAFPNFPFSNLNARVPTS